MGEENIENKNSSDKREHRIYMLVNIALVVLCMIFGCVAGYVHEVDSKRADDFELKYINANHESSLLGQKIDTIMDEKIKIIYCEDLNNMFVGLEDDDVNDLVRQNWLLNGNYTKTKPYILAKALYCKYPENTSCKPYSENEWIIGRQICKHFDFKVKELIDDGR